MVSQVHSFQEGRMNVNGSVSRAFHLKSHGAPSRSNVSLEPAPLPLCWMIYMKTIYMADLKVQWGLSRRHFGKMAYLAMPGLLARSLNCNTTEVGLTIRGNLDWLSEQNPWGDCYSLPTSSNTWRQVRFLIDSRLNPDSRLNTVLKLPK